MPEMKLFDENAPVCSHETKSLLVCSNCRTEEHENEQNGTLLYDCVGVQFCSNCYADEKANHPDFVKKHEESDDEDDKNPKITLTDDEFEYIRTNNDCNNLNFTQIQKLIEKNKKNKLIYDWCYKCCCTFATDIEYTECKKVDWGSYCHECWLDINDRYEELSVMLNKYRNTEGSTTFEKFLNNDA
tara:strand:- start:60 stop:617 length:558 start_codon:yes stop_codon:yes gene_type:complete